MKKHIQGIILSLIVIICAVITLEYSRAKVVSMRTVQGQRLKRLRKSSTAMK